MGTYNDPAYMQNYRKQHKDRLNKYLREWRRDKKRNQKSYNLRYNYGLSIAEYHQLLARASNCCEICGVDDDLAVDHCHTTKRIRGILCRKCNSGLGFLGDTVERLEKAFKYLRKEYNA